MPAGRTASVRCFCFELPPFTSHVMGGWEGRDAGVSLLSAATFLVCMPADREGKYVGHYSLLHFRRLIFTDWVGGRTVPAALNLRDGAVGIHARR